MPGFSNHIDLKGASTGVVYGTKPSAPSISSIDALNGGASINITPPSNLGNRPILRYVVKYADGSSVTTDGNAGSNSTTHGITGLANGSTYSFVVYAVNEFGLSDASAPVSVTPVAPYVPKGCEGTAVGAPGVCYSSGYNYPYGTMQPNTYFGSVSCNDGTWTIERAHLNGAGIVDSSTVNQTYAPC